jgi:hypothetical protein
MVPWYNNMQKEITIYYINLKLLKFILGRLKIYNLAGVKKL